VWRKEHTIASEIWSAILSGFPTRFESDEQQIVVSRRTGVALAYRFTGGTVDWMSDRRTCTWREGCAAHLVKRKWPGLSCASSDEGPLLWTMIEEDGIETGDEGRHGTGNRQKAMACAPQPILRRLCSFTVMYSATRPCFAAAAEIRKAVLLPSLPIHSLCTGVIDCIVTVRAICCSERAPTSCTVQKSPTWCDL
jgi:hypothetical protein